MLKKYDYEGFRPLSGNYISQKSQKKICLNSQVSFRPLSGNYISQFTVGKPHVLLFKKNVSVPCRGTTFLKIRRPFDDEFPGVSVPCRGTTFLNVGSKRNNQSYRQVSVPCRGTTFLKRAGIFHRLGKISFRPLSGNYISQSRSRAAENGTVCFRPLSGNYISQQKHR